MSREVLKDIVNRETDIEKVKHYLLYLFEKQTNIGVELELFEENLEVEYKDPAELWVELNGT